MSVFEARGDAVEFFFKKATADDIVGKMNDEKREPIVQFLRDYAKWKEPTAAQRDYRLKLAPLQVVFDRTHTLVGVAIGLLTSWSADAGNSATVLAETGALLVGTDEAMDLERVKKYQAAFVQFFGAEGLCPGLRKEALLKQEKEHLKARAALPPAPPLQTYRGFQSGQRTLAEACDIAFEAFHDFLDGHFGRKGTKAFEQKAAYGYNRRAGEHHATAQSGGTTPNQNQNKGQPATGGNTAPNTAPPQTAGTGSTPVIAGAGAQTPSQTNAPGTPRTGPQTGPQTAPQTPPRTAPQTSGPSTAQTAPKTTP